MDKKRIDPKPRRPLHLEDPWACYEDEDAVCSTTDGADDAALVEDEACGCCCCCD